MRIRTDDDVFRVIDAGRKLRGMSQTALAEEADISISLWWRRVRQKNAGKRGGMQVYTLLKILRALGLEMIIRRKGEEEYDP